LARVTSAVAGVRSSLASTSLRTLELPPAATTFAAEPAPAEVHPSSSPAAAAPGDGARAGAEPAAPVPASQQHVVVNFYHLTDIADPEHVRLLPSPVSMPCASFRFSSLDRQPRAK
jgi:hypothetical protein